jgi:integrase
MLWEDPAEAARDGRDEAIQRAAADGIPFERLAAWHGLTVAQVAQVVAAAPTPATPAGREVAVRTSSGRVLNPFDPDLPDPDMRRDPQAAVYHQESLSPSTRRAYRRFIEMWLDFCALTGRREFPANVFTLEAFAVWLAQRPMTRGKNKGQVGMAPASIELALSSVRAFHEVQGENLPSTKLARRVVDGHREIRARNPGIRDDEGSPAITLPTFAAIVAACDPATNAGLRDRAMLTLGLSIFARRHELVELDRRHVVPAQRDPAWLQVRIAHTKTGRRRKGQDRGRTAFVPPWAEPELDPVRAHREWVARCDELGIPDGPLYRAVDRHDNVQGVPGGAWAGRGVGDGRLDPATLESVILRAAMLAAVPNAEELRPHGVLRATPATEAYNAGGDLLAIARQGGWHERSPVIFRYIRDVDAYRRNPMLLLAQPERA